jgi:hypothetical protein
LASGVGFGVVEKVATLIVGGTHQFQCAVDIQLRAERHPSAKREFTDLQTGLA